LVKAQLVFLGAGSIAFKLAPQQAPQEFIFAIQANSMEDELLSRWYKAPILTTTSDHDGEYFIDLTQGSLLDDCFDFFVSSSQVRTAINAHADTFRLTANERLANVLSYSLGIGIEAGRAAALFGALPVSLVGGLAAAMSGSAAPSMATVLSVLFYPAAAAEAVIGIPIGLEKKHRESEMITESHQQ
jgi:hypothetical protein